MSATPALDLLTILDHHEPLSLGQVTVNADGVLELRQAAPPLQRAQFIWQGVPVRISLHANAERIICDIVADIGALPFSAQNPQQRKMLLAVLCGFRAPPDCRLMLGPRQVIWACQQTVISLPLAPAAVLAEITVFLHHMAPVIELMRDIQTAG